MGKGKRMRARRDPAASHLEIAERNAQKAARLVRAFCILTWIVAAVTLLVQAWCIATVNGNLAAGCYTADETAQLGRTLPLGLLGIAFMAIATVAVTALLLAKKWKPFILVLFLLLAIGAGVCFVMFALSLGDVFAYNEMKARGLTFTDLLVRHFTTLLTPLLLIVDLLLGHRAAKKHEAVQVMTDALDDTPTISLTDVE